MSDNKVKIDDLEISVSQETVNRALDMVDLIADPAFESSGLIGDVVRNMRQSLKHSYDRKDIKHRFAMQQAENLLNILAQARSKISIAQISQMQLQQKFLLPFLENAAREDDQDIQKMWTNILASEITDHDAENIRVVDKLKNLSPSSAQFLLKLAKCGSRISERKRDFMWEGRFQNLLGDEVEGELNDCLDQYGADDGVKFVEILQRSVRDRNVGYIYQIELMFSSPCAVEGGGIVHLHSSSYSWNSPDRVSTIEYLVADGLVTSEQIEGGTMLQDKPSVSKANVTLAAVSPAGLSFLSKVTGDAHVL